MAHLAANGIEAFIVDQVEGGLVPIEGEWGVAVVVKAVDAELAAKSSPAAPRSSRADPTVQRSRDGTNRSLAGDAPVMASAARITAAAVYDVVSSAGNTISPG